MSAPTRTTLLGLALSGAAGCSFVLGFPDDIVLDAGATGGAGGGNVGGGGAGLGGEGGAGGAGGAAECPDTSSVPVAEELLAFFSGGSFDASSISGVARGDAGTFLTGSYAGGGTFGLPASMNTTVYAVERSDAGAVTPLSAVIACEPLNGSFGTFGATLVGQDPVVVGFVPASGVATQVGFSEAGTPPCGGPDVTTVGAAGGTNSLIPFVANLAVAGGGLTVSDLADGTLLDAATGPSGVVALGVANARGDVWGQPAVAADLAYHLVRFAPGLTGVTDVAATAHLTDNTGYPSAVDLVGAVAVGADDTVYATGKRCRGGGGMCGNDHGLMVLRWPLGGSVIYPGETPGTPGNAFGAAIALAGDRLIIGGGFDGDIPAPGDDPSAQNLTDPLVMSVDPLDPLNGVDWTYPPPGGDPETDFGDWEAVVDLAVVAPPGCAGVVYVVGCTAGPFATFENCKHPYADSDKGGFLLKLDLETGARLGPVQFFGPVDPQLGMFSPTALAADDAGVFVAFHLLGAANPGPAVGQLSATSSTANALLLRFSP